MFWFRMLRGGARTDDESLTLIELIMWLEQELEIEFDDQTSWIQTIQDVADFIDGKRQEMSLLRPASARPSSLDPLSGRAL